MNKSAKTCVMLLCLTSGIPQLRGQSPLEEVFSLSRLAELRQTRLHHVSSNDTTGGNDDFTKIPAGRAVTILRAQGPGAIARIWMTVGSSDPYYLRRILLRMYWDGEADPSVEVPIGDFFGTGFGVANYSSLLVGMTSGGFFSYFPMPFDSAARIEIINETGRDVQSFYYNIDYQEFSHRLPAETGRFHACWHRNLRTTSKDNFVILEARGEGQFVGCNLNMQGYERNLSYLEGDEEILVDDEAQPSVKGTGTEDFFNSGWYFNRGEFSAPYHGLIVKDDAQSRIAAYRFMVGDAVPFRKSIRVSIEHGAGNAVAADYSSTAYWYQKEPHMKFEPIAKAGLRIPLRVAVPAGIVEAESLALSGSSLPSTVEEMTDLGPDWSGGRQRKVLAGGKGDSFTIDVPLPARRRVFVDLYYTTGPDYGNASVSLNGKPAVPLEGYAPEIVPGGALKMGNILPEEETVTLRITVTGKAGRSAGFAVGLDGIAIQPVKKYITRWNVAGPFPNPTDGAGERLGLDSMYLLESSPDVRKVSSGISGQQVRWKEVGASKDGLVDLGSRFFPNEHIVSYALAIIYSPVRQDLPLLLGSDDGVKVILNGKPVFRVLKDRPAVADQDTVRLALNKGRNTLLLKIENNLAGYGFYARIDDPGETLTYAIR